MNIWRIRRLVYAVTTLLLRVVITVAVPTEYTCEHYVHLGVYRSWSLLDQ